MKYIVKITEPAEYDLRSATHYITEVLLNPTAAIDLLNSTMKKFNSLSTMPERHALVDDPILRSFGIRQLIIDNYLGLYTVSSEEKVVEIIRFLHSGQNWIELLQETLSTK